MRKRCNRREKERGREGGTGLHKYFLVLIEAMAYWRQEFFSVCLFSAIVVCSAYFNDSIPNFNGNISVCAAILCV
jgi:hypothetical protein